MDGMNFTFIKRCNNKSNFECMYMFVLGALLRMTVKLSLFQHGHTEKRKFPTLYLRNYFTASPLDYFDDMLITFRQTEKI